MTYQEADQLLVGRCKASRKLANNTYLHRRDDGGIGLRLHATDVVTFYPDRFVLDTGGWYTATTKSRMNYAGGVNVYAQDGIWFVRSDLEVYAEGAVETVSYHVRYFDGITFDYQGNVLNDIDAPAVDDKQVAQIKRQIAAFVKLAGEQLKAGIPIPGGGDCWYCYFHAENGDTMGDAFNDVSHLREHIEEGYVVPSMLWNAVTEAGYRHPAFILGAVQGSETMGERALQDAVALALRKYLMRRLLPTQEGSKPIGSPPATGFSVKR